jgi:hypothetical protein
VHVGCECEHMCVYVCECVCVRECMSEQVCMYVHVWGVCLHIYICECTVHVNCSGNSKGIRMRNFTMCPPRPSPTCGLTGEFSHPGPSRPIHWTHMTHAAGFGAGRPGVSLFYL